MVAKQVIFKYNETDDFVPTGGIAIYEDFQQGPNCPCLELLGVFCGECGEWIPANDECLEIISVLGQWWSINDAIQSNIYPDDTSGFHPENQIRMELD